MLACNMIVIYLMFQMMTVDELEEYIKEIEKEKEEEAEKKKPKK